MKIKILTATMERLSMKNLMKESIGETIHSLAVGIPIPRKLACCTKIKNIASIRSNSMLDSLLTL
jgi:hypothetical protein